MFKVAFSLLLVALTLNAENAFGTNQHLTCTAVNCVYSDGTPGLTEVTRELQERIQTLEEKVLELTSTAQSTAQPTAQPTAQTTAQQDAFSCYEEEGFYYKTKCYNAILHTNSDVPYAKATELCTGNGGKPADILNAEHQSLVADYVRKKTSSTVQIWLGMSYRLSTGTLRFSNGNDVIGDVAASIRWWSGFPVSSSSHEAVAIAISTTTYGLFNIYPTYSTNGVLCEK